MSTSVSNSVLLSVCLPLCLILSLRVSTSVSNSVFFSVCVSTSTSNSALTGWMSSVSLRMGRGHAIMMKTMKRWNAELVLHGGCSAVATRRRDTKTTNQREINLNILLYNYSTKNRYVSYNSVQRFYIPTSRQVKRIEAVTRSPIFAHFSESLSGAATIRGYRATDRFVPQH